ncbi:MAG: tryptophan 7-halogenase [Pseudomonadota bacterium]
MKAANTHDVGRVVILGDGFEGCLAAASLTDAGVPVVVLPSLEAGAWDAAYTALPLRPDDLLGQLGVSELQLLIDHGGSYALGIDANDVTVPFGPTGIDFHGSRFHHHWRLASEPPFFAFSPSWVALQDGRFAPPVPQNAIDSLQHELVRLVDIKSLTNHLRTIAATNGATFLPRPLADVERNDVGGLAAVVDMNGQRHHADLYIDASGPTRQLLPSDSAWSTCGPSGTLSVSHSPTAALRPSITGTLTGDSCVVAFPQQSNLTTLRVDLDASATPTWVPGFRDAPWIDNCVSIGFAASHNVPLMPWHTSALMRSVRRLIDYLPDRHHSRPSRTTYNRQTVAEYAELQSIDHLLLAWARSRAPLSDALAARVALFEKRGFWHAGDTTLIDDCTWINTLFALGYRPCGGDVLAERWSMAERRRELRELRERITRVIAAFPTLGDYIAAAHRAVELRREVQA